MEKDSKCGYQFIPGPFGDYHWSMTPRQDKSNTATKGLGFNAGTEYMRWFYADEFLDKMLLNENRTAHSFAPLNDLYTCSEHFYTTWCDAHPGQKPELNVEYLVQRSDAVESGRTKLRACILLTEVKKALAASFVRKTAEHPFPPLPPPEALPSAKLAKIEAKFEQQDEEMGIAPMPKAIPKAPGLIKGLIKLQNVASGYVEPLNRPPGMPMFHKPGSFPTSFPTAQTPAGGSASGSSQPSIAPKAELRDAWDMPVEPEPADMTPDLEVLEVEIPDEVVGDLLMKAELEAKASAASAPMYTSEQAQAVVEHLATQAVVQHQMVIARAAVGAPMAAPAKAAPAVLKSIVAASSSQVELTPQLPEVPWARSDVAMSAVQPSGLGIPPLDTGRLKMDGKLSQEALIRCLQAALDNSEQPTTVAVGLNKSFTFGPPVFRDAW